MNHIEAMKQALSEVKALATFIGRYDPPSIPNLFTKRLNALADHLSQAIAEAEKQEPVLVVEKEPDYMSGGHFHAGTKPHIDPTKVWSLPIGTKLYDHPQPKQEPVAYDVRCDNCGGDGYDPKDNNYFCSSCEGAGFLEKLFYTHPQPKETT
jgi:hypothetical protein